jgi:hypothetical protein
MITTRTEHLAWAKERALEYLNAGQSDLAITSLLSDLRNHPETANHGGIKLTGMLMLGGFLTSPSEVRQVIEGFK